MSVEKSKEGLPQSANKSEVLESNDIQKKIDIINSTELSKLEGFDNFLDYLKRKSTQGRENQELENIITIIQNNGINKLIEYFDIDSISGVGFFDDTTFNKFKNDFSDYLYTQKADQTKTEADQTKTEADQTKTEADQTKIEVDQTKIEAVEELVIMKDEYHETIKILEKHSVNNSELKKIINEINNAENGIESIDKIKSKEDFKPIKEVLKTYEQQIFATLHEEAIKTNNTKDLKKVADNFKELGVITEDRYNEIYDWALEIDKKQVSSKSIAPELTPEYTARGDILYKKTENSSFSIKDGKITCKSNESGLKLVDYNSLDEEGKALADKMKLDSEIKELKSDLGDNLEKKKILDNIKLNIGNKDMQSINIDDLNSISSIIYDLPDNMTSLKDSLTNILQTSITPSEKIEYLIKMLYANITGSTNHSEIDNKEIRDIIFICNQKAEEKNNTLRDDILKNEKIIQELQKKFPNLDEKAIQDKIKSQETRMQDTVKFCDKFGLSSLGHISYIKKFTREINKQEVGNLLIRYKTQQFSGQNYITLVKYGHSLLFNSK